MRLTAIVVTMGFRARRDSRRSSIWAGRCKNVRIRFDTAESITTAPPLELCHAAPLESSAPLTIFFCMRATTSAPVALSREAR